MGAYALRNAINLDQDSTAGPRSLAGDSKVPQVAIAFWIIKIAATTLGETGGDALSMTMNFGYLLSTAIFMACFVAAVAVQIRAKAYHPFLYWTLIVTTTTVGTTMADFADRSLGMGYVGGSSLLFVVLMVVLAVWRYSVGSVSFSDITSAKVEIFYWTTILFSNTLGTALGDFLADTPGVGYERGALVFAGLLTLVAMAYFFTQDLPHLLVLGGVHPDAAAGRDPRRLGDQADRGWRTEPEPHQFVGRHRLVHGCVHYADLAPRGAPWGQKLSL